jgi:apolipoprotein D and lipocalin family protein
MQARALSLRHRIGRPILAIATGLLALAMTGCGQSRPLRTVAHVDLQRYAGKWVEVARLRNRFQRDNESAIAEYTPAGPGSVHVRNTALGPSGKTRSIEGTAEVVPGSNGARLRVRFSGFAALAPVSSEGNYWIIALDPQYRSAMVGTPDRAYLWILARTPQLESATLQRYLDEARRQGFATKDLLLDKDAAKRR